MTAPAGPLEARIDALSAALEDHRKSLARGEAVDLAGLDRETDALCRAVFDGKPESARFVPLLQALVTQLEQLAHDLKHHRDAVS